MFRSQKPPCPHAPHAACLRSLTSFASIALHLLSQSKKRANREQTTPAFSTSSKRLASQPLSFERLTNAPGDVLARQSETLALDSPNFEFPFRCFEFPLSYFAPSFSRPAIHTPPLTSRFPLRYTTAGMSATTILDTNWQGRPRSIAAVLLESGGHRALLDPGPASTLPRLRELLAARNIGVSDLNAILLTHIHLDHAGATGALIKENPNLEVYVHKTGMMHLADPKKLLASAERIWPGELQKLFGETLPVPFGNLRMLEGGETLALGSRNLEVIYTPGHAAHHVSYFDSSDGTAFVGDTAGFHIEGEPYVVPLTPPPDIDLDAWKTSLDAIAARHPARLFLTHFGYSSDPKAHIAEYRKNLKRWSALAAQVLRSAPDERSALEAFVAATSSEIKQRVAAAEAEHYIFNSGLNISWLGLARYHRKRAEAAAGSEGRANAS